MKLLYLDHEEMRELGDKMTKSVNEIKSNAQKLAWYMRGGASYEDILNMSREELDGINQLIEENLDTTKKTKLPFF